MLASPEGRALAGAPLPVSCVHLDPPVADRVSEVYQVICLKDKGGGSGTGQGEPSASIGDLASVRREGHRIGPREPWTMGPFWHALSLPSRDLQSKDCPKKTRVLGRSGQTSVQMLWWVWEGAALITAEWRVRF